MGIAALIKSAELSSPNLHVLSDSELRNLQLLLVEMLNDMAEICREHDIAWSLAGGSALGAVRHKGFIPWDDDIDVAMLRADFERLKQVFPGKYSDKYELKIPGDVRYLYHFPRIYRKGTIAKGIQSEQDDKAEGVAIDIFIMENCSDNRIVRTFHGLACNMLLLIDSSLRMKRCQQNLLEYGASSRKLCLAVKLRSMMSLPFGFMPLERWLKFSDKIFSLCRDRNSEYIVIPSGVCHYFGELYLRHKMENVMSVDFEYAHFFIPRDFEYLLSKRYGNDYISLPPVGKREKHLFIEFSLDVNK